MSGPLPYMQFWVKEYLIETRRLSPAAKGCLWDLLCFQWEEGCVPDDPPALARMAGCDRPEFLKKIWPELQLLFEVGEDGCLRHPRVHKERLEAFARCQTAQAKGKLGGRPRKVGGTQKNKPEDSRKKPGGFLEVNLAESQEKPNSIDSNPSPMGEGGAGQPLPGQHQDALIAAYQAVEAVLAKLSQAAHIDVPPPREQVLKHVSDGKPLRVLIATVGIETTAALKLWAAKTKKNGAPWQTILDELPTFLIQMRDGRTFEPKSNRSPSPAKKESVSAAVDRRLASAGITGGANAL
ncbi:MAG TPA: DUF1376 domain-containing protein [Fimbriimonas sp.]|nr:DUF1376 domain-containing protein [Fimbriimonas sp.]